jgi:hypothetical protein
VLHPYARPCPTLNTRPTDHHDLDHPAGTNHRLRGPTLLHPSDHPGPTPQERSTRDTRSVFPSAVVVRAVSNKNSRDWRTGSRVPPAGAKRRGAPAVCVCAMEPCLNAMEALCQSPGAAVRAKPRASAGYAHGPSRGVLRICQPLRWGAEGYLVSLRRCPFVLFSPPLCWLPQLNGRTLIPASSPRRCFRRPRPLSNPLLRP